MTGRTRRGWGRWAAYAYAASGVLALAAAGILHPGLYYGHLSGSIWPTQEILHINAVAETGPRWRWVFPRTHSYDSVCIARKADKNWELHIDLASRTWRLGDETGPLDAAALDRLMPADQWSQPDSATRDERLAHLVSVLESMGNGSFPPARHHGYASEKPFRAYYSHGTLGMSMGLPFLGLWCLVWPVYLVVCRRAYRGVRASPGKVYLVTLGVVVAADALCSLLHVMFSPGPVAELMEFLSALVNLPAAVLLGNYVLTPIGFVTGAVLWATLLSIVAAFRARRRLLASADAC